MTITREPDSSYIYVKTLGKIMSLYIFGVNLELLTKLINSAFVGV